MWFFKKDINRLCVEFKNLIFEQIEDYLDFVKNEEGSIFEKTFHR